MLFLLEGCEKRIKLFIVKMEPEFFDPKLICITFPDKRGEGLTRIMDFKIRCNPLTCWVGVP